MHIASLTKPAATFLAAVFVCLSALVAPAVVQAQGYETQARAAYVYDHASGQVLLALNADEALPPASMSKLMTLLMAFEALRDGRLSLDTRVPVSEHAMSFGGSTMFLNTQDRPTIEDLIRGIVIVSGNDASVALGEALSPDGTEEGFATMMTQRAQQLGMMNSTFRNASGWPAEGHRMSMRDLGILTVRLIEEFPEYYAYFQETEFDYENRSPANRFNRNPLLGLGVGADGLKTGHTQEAGYGLAGSAMQGDRRVSFVITGLSSAEARAAEAERIVTWAFRQFVMRDVVEPGVELARAPVFLGSQPTVGLAPSEGIEMLLPALLDPEIEATLTYTSPLPAPISAGDVVGELHVVQGVHGFEARVPVVVMEDVPRGGPMVRIGAAWSNVMGLMSRRGDEAPAS
ncbi:D-alanyl-D-alanine carboxypeptidase [Rhodobacteraceae bacterium N5(2021)]|uniref:serine-type D-Ala-D-Ala carboxypeptidase n=1 Tax=Gymnodinialimonas phycosphaerae TaxID=2841589 RepID=A0A975TV84_9RHOB|nr:D-alanyl-D-alanine carboxypeptidase family protein [Gymnodinialimonas phycosphaerae]MBY4895301.1 D-alanyl-D-alanine carboxypeptidase [Gymnodinialimonas phycosphaerae]